MKTLKFSLISDCLDSPYGPDVDSFELELEDEEAAFLQKLAEELGEVTEEELKERNPELSEKISEEAWVVFGDFLECEGYGCSGLDVLNPDIADDFDEEKYNTMDFREGAEYLRKFGSCFDIFSFDGSCTFSFPAES